MVGGEPLAVVGEHGVNGRRAFRLDDLPDHVVPRQVERPQRLDAVQPRSAARAAISDRLRLRSSAIGFSTSDVLARSQREQWRGVVEVVRRGDVNDVDLGIGERSAYEPCAPAESGTGPRTPSPTAGRATRRRRPAGGVLRRRAPANRSAIQPEPSTPHRRAGAAIGSGSAGGRERAGKLHGQPAPASRAPPSCIDVMAASATALAVTPSRPVASGRRRPARHASPPRPAARSGRRRRTGAASRPRSRCRAAVPRRCRTRAGSVRLIAPSLADDLAADVVAVAGVQERLAGAQHAVRGAQADQLRVLQPSCDLRRAARRHPRHLDHGRAQQPRHDVELVDRRTRDRELRSGVRGPLTPRLMLCTSTGVPIVPSSTASSAARSRDRSGA